MNASHVSRNLPYFRIAHSAVPPTHGSAVYTEFRASKYTQISGPVEIGFWPRQVSWFALQIPSYGAITTPFVAVARSTVSHEQRLALSQVDPSRPHLVTDGSKPGLLTGGGVTRFGYVLRFRSAANQRHDQKYQACPAEHDTSSWDKTRTAPGASSPTGRPFFPVPGPRRRSHFCWEDHQRRPPRLAHPPVCPPATSEP